MRSLLAFAITALVVRATAASANETPNGHVVATVVINEALLSHASIDNTEYVELYGPPGTSLGGLSLIAVEGDAAPAKSGEIDRRIDFHASDALGANGSFLVGNPAGLAASYGVTPDLPIGQDSFENSSLTLALVQTSSLSGRAVTGAEVVIDSVGLTDGGAGDVFYFAAPVVGPDGTFFPAGFERLSPGVDTDTAADVELAVFDLGPGNTPAASSGAAPPVPVPVTVPQIQGSGTTSPYAGARVETTGVVVGDFQGASQLAGFFLQDGAGDGSPMTSDGLFVLAPGATNVNLGDVVTVVGTVAEKLQNTRIQGVTSVVVSGRAPLPAAATLALPESTNGDLERYEGMRVALPAGVTVSGMHFLGRYGQLTLAGPGDDGAPGRLFQPTSLFPPRSQGAVALADENARRILILDDGQDVSPLGDHPNPVPYLGPAPGIVLRSGDAVQNAVGVLDQGRINSDLVMPGVDYRLHPTSAPTFVAQSLRTARPPAVAGRLRFASFNVLNYFSTTDNGPNVCGPARTLHCRGADTTTERARQREKILAALTGLTADVIGLVELENNASAAVQELANGLDSTAGPGAWAFVNTGTIGTDAVKVAFLYRTAKVAPWGSFRTLSNAVDVRAIDTKNRPALAQTFREKSTGELVTAVVNHWKSKGSDCNRASAPGELVDPDTGDGQGHCNRTRTSNAEALRDWLASDPTESGDSDFLILGDLNAYGQEDPVRTLLAAGYTDVVAARLGPQAYSYGFDGWAGRLDHALANASLDLQIQGVALWHINADEPAVLDYNTERNPPGYYAANAYRSSDHDPVLVGVSLCVDRTDLAALQAEIRTAPTDPRYDLDGDGRVTAADARLLALRFTSPGGAPCRSGP